MWHKASRILISHCRDQPFELHKIGYIRNLLTFWCFFPNFVLYLFIDFHTGLSFGEVAEAAAVRGLKIPHSQQQSQTDLLAPRQEGAKQDRRCTRAIWFLGRILGRFPVGVASRYCLSNLSWYILDPWPKNTAGVSRFAEVAEHSGLYEFHSCALCREVPHRELFTQISSVTCT